MLLYQLETRLPAEWSLSPEVGAAVGNLIGSISIKIQKKLQNGMGSKHVGKKKIPGRKLLGSLAVN